jgi:putative ABC transport system substrate-binding protein
MISVSTRLDRIVGFAAQKRLPAIYQFREYAVAGGLISYGPTSPRATRTPEPTSARSSRAKSSADLPVMQPTKFDFLINLRTAKALRLTVPLTLLAEAGEVIE